MLFIKTEHMLRKLLKPLSHQTAMPHRLNSVRNICQRALGSPRNMPKHIKLARYSAHTTSLHRAHNVLTACTHRPYIVHTTSLQRAHNVPTSCTQRPYIVHTTSLQRAPTPAKLTEILQDMRSCKLNFLQDLSSNYRIY